MLWLTIWGVLIIGTITGIVLLGLRLYRKARRFLAQLEQTTVLMDRLAEKSDELADLRPPDPVFTPDIAATDSQRDHWRQTLALNRDRRALRRRRRRQVTLERWRRLGLG